MPSGLASASQIVSALKGISLPANRQDLIEYAAEHTKDESVLTVLDFFPEGDFESAADIAKGISYASKKIKNAAPRVSASEITTSIRGISFPASREDMVNQAKENGANENVVSVLANLPDKEYRNAVDISKGISEFKSTFKHDFAAKATAARQAAHHHVTEGEMVHAAVAHGHDVTQSEVDAAREVLRKAK